MIESDHYRLVRLANQVWSVRSDRYAETYHPVVGPEAEAEALYVKQLRLRERVRDCPGPFTIWDVGLGAAGNVLTLLRATRDLAQTIRVLSFDRTLEPLRFGLRHADELPYLQGYEAAVTDFLEDGQHGVEFMDGARSVQWRFVPGDFPARLESDLAEGWPKPHVVLFDAFSPASNPEMWTLPLFEGLARAMDPERPCLMPTYSRSTMLRVTWLLAGLYVGAGHATGEKEETTVAANQLDLLEEPLEGEWLSRVRRSTSAEPLRDGVYRQAPLSAESWERLQRHPQFAGPGRRSNRRRATG